MSQNDKTAEKLADIVLDVYRYALDNDMDFTSKENIQKILDVLKPENPSDINIDVLIQGLVSFDRMAKTESKKRQKPESN